MKLEDLKQFGMVYVATPFTLYEPGLEAAFVDACKLMGGFLNAGVVNALSPIVEAYPISLHGGIDPLDMAIWGPFCAARMRKSGALVVGMLDGWEKSNGTRHELETFAEAQKPIYFLDPVTMVIEPATPEERELLLAGRAA